MCAYPFPRTPTSNRLTVEIHAGRESIYTNDWGNQGKTPYEDSFGRLYLLEAGTITVRNKGHAWKLAPGELWLMPPHFKAYYSCSEPMQLLWIHFNAFHLPQLDVFEHCEPMQHDVTDDEVLRMRTLVAQLQKEVQWDDIKLPAQLASLLLPFFARLESANTKTNGRDILRPALHAVAAHYAEPCPVTRLARAVNLHPVYFSRLFKEQLGLPPAQYVTRVRMHHASLQLLHSAASIKQIASACGYPDPYHFSRAFKRHYGISPRAYKRLQSC